MANPWCFIDRLGPDYVYQEVLDAAFTKVRSETLIWLCLVMKYVASTLENHRVRVKHMLGRDTEGSNPFHNHQYALVAQLVDRNQSMMGRYPAKATGSEDVRSNRTKRTEAKVRRNSKRMERPIRFEACQNLIYGRHT